MEYYLGASGQDCGGLEPQDWGSDQVEVLSSGNIGNEKPFQMCFGLLIWISLQSDRPPWCDLLVWFVIVVISLTTLSPPVLLHLFPLLYTTYGDARPARFALDRRYWRRQISSRLQPVSQTQRTGTYDHGNERLISTIGSVSPFCHPRSVWVSRGLVFWGGMLRCFDLSGWLGLAVFIHRIGRRVCFEAFCFYIYLSLLSTT